MKNKTNDHNITQNEKNKNHQFWFYENKKWRRVNQKIDSWPLEERLCNAFNVAKNKRNIFFSGQSSSRKSVYKLRCRKQMKVKRRRRRRNFLSPKKNQSAHWVIEMVFYLNDGWEKKRIMKNINQTTLRK